LLKSPSLDLLSTIPQKLTEMHESASSLSPPDSSSLPVTLVDPGKRQWETSKTGYVNWAVTQLVESTKEEDGRSTGKSSNIHALNVKVEEIGSADGFRRVVEAHADGSAWDQDE
jgi:kinetochore protein Mis12/MTW1